MKKILIVLMGCILMCGCHKTKKETIQTTKLNVETLLKANKLNKVLVPLDILII